MFGCYSAVFVFVWNQFWFQKWLKADLCRWELFMVPFKFFTGSTILYGCRFGCHTIYVKSEDSPESALSLPLYILCMHEHFHFHAWLAAYWDISDSMFSSSHAHVDLHIFLCSLKCQLFWQRIGSGEMKGLLL